MSALVSHSVEGHVRHGFENVREVFAGNFARRRELGGACCAYVHGEKVVDLWGGIRNKQTGDSWEEDTMVIVHSATKGLAAMTNGAEILFGRLMGLVGKCTECHGNAPSRAGADNKPRIRTTFSREVSHRN